MNPRSPRARWRPDNGFYVAYALLQGRQAVACSDACRGRRWRRRGIEARRAGLEARDREVRGLLEAALRRLGEP